MSDAKTKKTDAKPLPLSEGCDLWIVSDFASSTWARKIDWYIGFQMMRSDRHTPKQLPEVIKEIDREWPVDLIDIEVDPLAPLMIATEALLPNTKTVMIPFRGDCAEWVAKCKGVWQDLGKPAVRIFLPDSVTPSDCRWGRTETGVEMIPGSELSDRPAKSASQ